MDKLSKAKVFKCGYLSDEGVRQMVSRRDSSPMEGWDMYILGRIHRPRAGNPFEQFGVPIVYETDDDLLDDYRNFGSADWVEETVSFCDAVITSTEYLGSRMSKLGKPVYVLENYIDVDFYAGCSAQAERADDRVTVGLVGTQTHWTDWCYVVTALERIKAKHGNKVLVVTGGYLPSYLKKIVDINFAPLPFPQYPAILRQLDIRLCPLENDYFNYSKSPLAALEAMAAARPVGKKTGGAVPICIDGMPTYGIVKNKVNGLKVPNDGWFDAIDHLVRNSKFRNSLAVAGHRWVRAHRDVSLAVGQWAQTLNTILEA
jgi:glycosyltransferase involved in cell wall biosynthesis